MMEENMMAAPSVTTKSKINTPTIPEHESITSSIIDLPKVPTAKVVEEDPDLAELKALEAEFA